MARTRERGFDVDWTTPALAQAAQLVGTLESDEIPTPVRQIMDQLLAEFTTSGFLFDDNADGGKRPVVTIAAPVFDHRQGVALIMALHPLRVLTARRIRSIGERLVEEATLISNG